MKASVITSIGTIHVAYRAIEKSPIQPCCSKEVDKVELLSEYEEGFKKELAAVKEQILELKR